MTESMIVSFRAERAVSPRDGSELWAVLDPGLAVHREASDFLPCLPAPSGAGVLSLRPGPAMRDFPADWASVVSFLPGAVRQVRCLRQGWPGRLGHPG